MNVLKPLFRVCLERQSSVGVVRLGFRIHWLGMLMIALGAPSGLRADVRFNRDIRPILSDNCLGCHGPDAEQRKGKLRLDRRDDAIQPAESGEIAIVPGHPEKSALVDRENPALGRSALALWLTRADHPLTARVMLNRIWQWYFGQGLVRTAGDFGRQGESPSHSELLDWLASELISNHWDLRHIERIILNSATYRQSSIPSAAVKAADPEGRLLGAFPRRRLHAEGQLWVSVHFLSAIG